MNNFEQRDLGKELDQNSPDVKDENHNMDLMMSTPGNSVVVHSPNISMGIPGVPLQSSPENGNPNLPNVNVRTLVAQVEGLMIREKENRSDIETLKTRQNGYEALKKK